MPQQLVKNLLTLFALTYHNSIDPEKFMDKLMPTVA